MASVGYLLIVTIKLATTGDVIAVVRQGSSSGLMSSLLPWPPLLGAYFLISLYLITHKAPTPSELYFLLLVPLNFQLGYEISIEFACLLCRKRLSPVSSSAVGEGMLRQH